MTRTEPEGGNRSLQRLLPEAGDGRWWRVTHNARSRTNPIRVELMECFSGNRRAMSRPLGFELTIADPKRVAESAREVLARVADYKLVVGEYGGE